MVRWLYSLKFQVTAVLLTLLCLFIVSSYYLLNALRVERQDDALLSLGSEMQLIGQQLSMQAMNYKENAPRDYPTYFRDLRLYYRDLMDKTNRMTGISSLFTGEQGMPDGEGMMADFSDDASVAAKELSHYWASFDQRLRQRLGDNPDEPRLEWAAEFIIESSTELQDQIARFWAVLETTAQARASAAERLYEIVLALSAVFALGLLWWFYFRVVRPLGDTMEGVRRVAAGDFSYRIPIEVHNEVGGLNMVFNQLSARLNAMMQLLTRLQEGGDLEETLGVMAETLPQLLPVDWTGILFITADRSAQLEAAYLDGAAATNRPFRFPVPDTPLETALDNEKPQRIHDLQGLAASNSRYRLIRHLSSIGMRDAIFMPIKEQSAMPCVLVFATRRSNAYTAEQVTLLSNLALLITLSFGKTLKLVEQARLAAIGQFVSGIAHEIRNPLATITLALDYLKSAELPPGSTKRIHLAAEEGARMARLLDEMLLYAKPMRLNVRRTRLSQLIDDVAGGLEIIGRSKGVGIDWPTAQASDIEVDADADRLHQVLANLVHNAIEASPADARVLVTVRTDLSPQQVTLTVTNWGTPIPPGDLNRLFEPFFSTKPTGTGLGLGIVRRITHAHGGGIAVSSDAKAGTTFEVTLPLPSPS